MPRPFILAETNWKTVKETEYDVAILPWGATEAHNYHLPYSTDVVESDYIAEKAAEKAWQEGARPIVLPCVPFGVNTTQLDIKLDLNLNPSTQFAIIRDLASALSGQGITKLIILNGHGGNNFRQMVRELQPQFPNLYFCVIDWFKIIPTEGWFDDQGDHAGEMETSFMMHVAPALVRPLTEAGSGAARAFNIDAMKAGWAWAPRQWQEVTPDTGVGNPATATAEKGKRYVDAIIQKISCFLVDFAKADIHNMYEGERWPEWKQNKKQ